jgi:hypothetical protein
VKIAGVVPLRLGSDEEQEPMKGLKRALLVLTLATLPTACYTAKVYVAPREARSGEVYYHIAWNFLWGLQTVGAVHAGEQCDYGVREVKTRIGLPGIIIGELTAGIITPLTVEVTCVG